MIPFFRKIRNPPAGEAGKMADDNKPMKYMRYAVGEIVLVVIGILIALSINNWNETRKEKLKTKSYLLMLSNEIENNLIKLETAKKIAISRRKWTQKTLTELNSDSAKFMDLDHFYNLTTSKGPFWKVELERSVFDDLISSGVMENVNDSLLRNQIFKIESYLINYERYFNDVQIIWVEQIRPYHIEHLNESRIMHQLKLNFETDLDAFVHNRKYANMLTGKMIFIGNFQNSIRLIKEKLTITLEKIRPYIDKTPSTSPQ